MHLKNLMQMIQDSWVEKSLERLSEIQVTFVVAQ